MNTALLLADYLAPGWHFKALITRLWLIVRLWLLWPAYQEQICNAAANLTIINLVQRGPAYSFYF